MNKVTFARETTFFDELKKSVDNYFAENNLKPTGDIRLYTKCVVFIIAAAVLYTWIVFFTPSNGWLALLLCGLFGLAQAGIGFNIMHDACHGSFSSKKWVNTLFGLSMNAIGSADFIWKLKHNVIHHTYTNVDGIDDDIAKEPFIRHCETQRKRKMHRYQHIYVIPLYTITTLYWALYTDFAKYFSRKVHSTPMRNISTTDHIMFWASKLLYVFFYMAIPIYLLGWTKFLIGFLFMHAVFGLTLAIVFQLAHAVEDAHFDEAINKSKKIEQEWAVYQVITTANFATDNKLITWFVGGLNFQVEHHLFPRVSHVHYPALSKLVAENCRKFNIPYNHFPTMTSAIRSHLRLMKQLGN